MRPSRQPFAAAALLVAAGALAYLPALGNGFVYDDHGLVLERAARATLGTVWSGEAYPDYWPLTYTVLWGAWRLFGPWATGHHLLVLALHLLGAVLLWRALRAFGVPGAWAGGLLFAVHPATVESAAWISELKNTLSTPLFLGAAMAWRRADDGEGRPWAALSAGLFGGALLAKSAVVMLPVVLLGACLYRRGRINRRDLARVGPHLALALLAGAVTLWFHHQRAVSQEWLPLRGPVERLTDAGWALLTYLRDGWLPLRLGFVQAPFPRAPDPLAWAGLAGATAILALLWRLRAGRARVLWPAAAYQALVVLPVLGLVDMAYLRVGPSSNHLQYLGLLGPCAAGGGGLAWLRKRWPRVGGAAAGLLVAALGAVTWTRAGEFRDDLTLWSAAAKRAPGSFVARWELARALALRERYAEVEGVLRAASTELDPAGALRARSLLALAAGDHRNVVSQAWQAEALRSEPAFLLYAGRQLVDAGAPAEAVAVLGPLAARLRRASETRYWLAVALARLGRREEAGRALAEAERLAPPDGDARRALEAAGLATRLR